VQRGLKAFPAARKAIRGPGHPGRLQQHEMLVLGGLDLEQKRCKEALVIFDNAKAVLAQHKEGNDYGALLNDRPSATRNCNSGARPFHASRRLLRLPQPFMAPTSSVRNRPEQPRWSIRPPQAVRGGHPANGGGTRHPPEGVW
jgi:hypothetical protein